MCGLDRSKEPQRKEYCYKCFSGNVWASRDQPILQYVCMVRVVTVPYYEGYTTSCVRRIVSFDSASLLSISPMQYLNLRYKTSPFGEC